MDLVDDVVLQRVRRLDAGAAAGIGEDHALGRERPRVDEPVCLAGQVSRAVGMGGRLHAMADLAGIRVEQQLVGVETIAVLVDVGDEAVPRARRPGRVVAPVRPEGAVAVVDRSTRDRVGGGDGRDERAIVPPRHRLAQHRLGTRRLGVEAELDALRRRRTDPEGDAVVGDKGTARGLCHSWNSRRTGFLRNTPRRRPRQQAATAEGRCLPPMLALNVSGGQAGHFFYGNVHHKLVHEKAVSICPRDGDATRHIALS